MLQVATKALRLQYEDATNLNQSHIVLSGQNGKSWQRKISSSVTTSPILLLPEYTDLVFVAYGLDVYALNSNTGDIHWQRHIEDPLWGGQVIDENSILLHAEQSVTRMNIQGKEIWRYRHSEIITEIRVQDLNVLATDLNGNTMTLDLDTGSLLK
jgi:hypothetical protein